MCSGLCRWLIGVLCALGPQESCRHCVFGASYALVSWGLDFYAFSRSLMVATQLITRSNKQSETFLVFLLADSMDGLVFLSRLQEALYCTQTHTVFCCCLFLLDCCGGRNIWKGCCNPASLISPKALNTSISCYLLPRMCLQWRQASIISVTEFSFEGIRSIHGSKFELYTELHLLSRHLRRVPFMTVYSFVAQSASVSV